MSRLGRLFDKFRPARAGAQQETTAPLIEMRWVIAGLGNPGEQYARSRHNAGFRVAERLAARHGAELNRRKFSGLYVEIRTDAGVVLIVKPQTFYNRSGECISAMISYFKVPAERLIVVHDEMDLPAGQLRIKRGGGDAGNRGVRSISTTLGTPDFVRVRIGIGHSEACDDSINHVLKPLTAAEIRTFDAILDRAADAVIAIMREGLDRAMNLYNQRA
jgi:peptidyl-tRNA hydrolase, PTH1 family